MSRPVDLVLSKLENPKRSSGCWVAKCPAHDDSHASLSVREFPDGSAGVKCFTGCSTDMVLAAIGMTRRDLFDAKNAPEAQQSKSVRRVHVYGDEQGKPYSRKTVVKHPDGKKSAVWEHSDDGGKTWQAERGDRRDLYNLPEVLAAVAAGKTVYLNEGEKGADACMVAGLCGTTHGGGAAEWPAWASDRLRGAKVVVVADRDGPGEEWARYRVVPSLRRLDCKVRVVQSATSNPGDDAWDHFFSGREASALVKRPDLLGIDALPQIVLNGKFQPVLREYLWEPYLPKGKAVLLDADGGVGKTTLALALAAGLSRGVLPNGEGRCEPCKTLYLHQSEDPTEELETVYRACCGVEGMIGYVETLDRLDDRGCAMLEATIEAGGYGLVVVDSLFYFLAGLIGDSHQAFDVVQPLKRIMRVYQSTNAVGLHIRHTGKETKGKEASNLGLGSVQFRNSHRGQLVAMWHPTRRGLVVVRDLKGSILSERGNGFAYRRIGNAVEYVSDFEDDATDFAGDPRQWLIDTLARYGPAGVDQSVIRDAADALGIWSRVRKIEGVAVKARKGGVAGDGRWVWKLSPDVDPFADAPTAQGWWAE